MKSVKLWVLIVLFLTACDLDVSQQEELSSPTPQSGQTAVTPTAPDSTASSIIVVNNEVAAAELQGTPYTCPTDPVNPLSLPPTPGPDTNPADAYQAFNREMQAFLLAKCYQQYEEDTANREMVALGTPGWLRDKYVRPTGLWIDDSAYGVHPSVWIYYNPTASEWLVDGRVGEPPDGAFIIKTMYTDPANQYTGLEPDQISAELFEGWTVMLKDSGSSKDGWYWGGFFGSDPLPSPDAYPFQEYTSAGFGQINACLRCHASAEEDTFTFISLRNVAANSNFPETAEDPLNYRTDNSWLTPSPTSPPTTPATPTPIIIVEPNPEFLTTFTELSAVPLAAVTPIPPITYDTVVAGADGPDRFLTSNQCTTCHGGLSGPPFGPTMYLPPEGDLDANFELTSHDPGGPHSQLSADLGGEGINLSPSGEWHWSMMGLAGRDPVFFAQLEGEGNLHPDNNIPGVLQDTCLRCHGVMGQRQFHLDNGEDSLFLKEQIFETNKYGALARDGISCMVCHQIADASALPTPLPLEDIDTGRFVLEPTPEPGKLTINGPFDDPLTLPMESALGLIPMENEFIKDSGLCASCHTIRLPVFDAESRQLVTAEDPNLPFQLFEQTTFLEWVNSAFADQGSGQFQSCQDCHMPDTFPYQPVEAGTPTPQPLSFEIASIQNSNYPFYDNQAPLEEIDIGLRDGFVRHSLHGINLFSLEMFNQFDRILGVSKSDYMTGNTTDLDFAIESYVAFAQQNTADVTVSSPVIAMNGEGDMVLRTAVTVANKAGHRFPSGVGFRRAFLEFLVLDSGNNVVWSSGRTNSVGVVVDGNGQPLPSEFHNEGPDGQQSYQPHYEVITQPNQVQIYEELTVDPQGLFTSSFVSRCRNIKDNRLLPDGWSETPPGFPNYDASAPSFPLNEPTIANSDCESETSLEATFPRGTENDSDYSQGGGDTVTYEVRLSDLPESFDAGSVIARLYYQAIPPNYLADRFEAGRQGGGEELTDAERLYYLSSNLNVEGTYIEDWKLLVSSASQPISQSNEDGEEASAFNNEAVSLFLMSFISMMFLGIVVVKKRNS